MRHLPDDFPELFTAPFPERLRTALVRIRDRLGLQWVGVVDHAAPDGTLQPAWMAWSGTRAGGPEAAPPVDQATWDRLWDGDLSAFPGPQTAFQQCFRLTSPQREPDASPQLLLMAAAIPPEASALDQTRDTLALALANHRHERLARRVFEAVHQAPDPLELTDRSAHLVYANVAWRELFGHDPHASYGQTMATLFRDSDAPVHDGAFYQFTMNSLRAGRSWLGALACRTASGRRQFIEVNVGPFSAPEFMGNVAIRRDLSHRAERDQALANAHHEFRRVLRALPDGAVVLRQGRIYFANPSFLAMVGETEAEVIGSTLDDYVHPDDAAKLLYGDGVVEQVRFQGRVGPPRIADVSQAGVLSFEGRPATIVLSRDVTDQRIAREMLARAERLSALGALAAGLAHEINNPLAYLILNLETLRNKIGADLSDENRETLLEGLDGARRIHRIVTELRAFSGSDHEDPIEHVVVANAITSALNIAQNEIRHRATLTRSLEPGVRVQAREGPLVQVLVSLFVNAAQAIPEGSPQLHSIEVQSRTEGDVVVITVSDTGVGIPTSALPHVFDPFYTSKPRKEGSGLGLSIARRIVEELGGRIDLSSEVGVGTTASIVLPRGRTATTGPPSRVSEVDRARIRARILVVDDEPSILRALARVLDDHSVTTCSIPADAISALTRDGPFDVIVCDLMMPGLSGPELFRRATDLRPNLASRFLFMTGGAFADGILAFLETWRLPVLEKPFDPSALRVLVSEIATGKHDAS